MCVDRVFFVFIAIVIATDIAIVVERAIAMLWQPCLVCVQYAGVLPILTLAGIAAIGLIFAYDTVSTTASVPMSTFVVHVVSLHMAVARLVVRATVPYPIAILYRWSYCNRNVRRLYIRDRRRILDRVRNDDHNNMRMRTRVPITVRNHIHPTQCWYGKLQSYLRTKRCVRACLYHT